MANIPQQAMLMGQNVIAAGQSIPMELMSIGQRIATESAAGRPVDALLDQKQAIEDAKQTLADLGLYLKAVPRYLKERKEYTVAHMDRLAGREPRERRKPGRSGRAAEAGPRVDTSSNVAVPKGPAVALIQEELTLDNPLGPAPSPCTWTPATTPPPRPPSPSGKQLVDRDHAPSDLYALACALPKRCSYISFRAAVLATERDHEDRHIPGCYGKDPSDQSLSAVQAVIDARLAENAAKEPSPPEEPEPVEDAPVAEFKDAAPGTEGLSDRDAAIHLFFT